MRKEEGMEGQEGEEIQGEKMKERQREVGLGRVLTEPSEQLSDSVSSKRIKSLMKTETALRMKDMKRCIWI